MSVGQLPSPSVFHKSAPPPSPLLQGPDLDLWLEHSCGASVSVDGRSLALVAGGAMVDRDGDSSDDVFAVDLNTGNVERLSNDGFKVRGWGTGAMHPLDPTNVATVDLVKEKKKKKKKPTLQPPKNFDPPPPTNH